MGPTLSEISGHPRVNRSVRNTGSRTFRLHILGLAGPAIFSEIQIGGPEMDLKSRGHFRASKFYCSLLQFVTFELILSSEVRYSRFFANAVTDGSNRFN